MALAICPGSFDPITYGHIDVIRRARIMFDEVIVAVSINSAKRYMFSDDERLALAVEALEGMDGVHAELSSGLLAEFAADHEAVAIVKGLRGAGDYDNEATMALINRHISGVETVFIMGDPALGHVASSYTKEIASYGGKIDDLVPPHVARAIEKKVTP